VRRFLHPGLVLVVGLLAAVARGAEDAPGGVPSGKDAIAPAAPGLPADVVAALQEKRFAQAIAALDKLADDPQTKDPERAYFALVRGIARRLAGRLDQARAGLQAAIEKAPRGPWAAKLRGELAAVELAAGRFAAAEDLARAEAESLLADARKDRLAEVYHAFARRLLKPDEPTTPPDPEGAYALLDQARALAKGQTLRARLLLEMGRASQQAGNPGRAIENFQAYLKESPQGADRAAARFLLGEAQLAAGQPLPARLSWSDLARVLEGQDTKDAVAFRARALYQVAHTYGIPNPPDDTQMGLGIAALRRFLEAYPSHPLAVTAAYEIGASYLARGKGQPALEALTAFLKGEGFEAEADDAKRDRTRLAMAAQFQVGQILQGQERFAEATAAFQAYLAQFPNGPQSADAQRAILDTQLLVAQEHLRREEYARARAAWGAFVAQNPLDARVPQVLFQVGESFALEKKFDEAIAAWETLAGKFPGTEPAAHAQFQVAATLETEKADPATAIERFRKIAVEPWQAQARQRVAVMEAKSLTVVTPRTFRSGETAHLKVASRNIERLTFTAYKLDAEAYFRKKHAMTGIEALDIGLVAPDAEWTAEVKGYARYAPIETTYELKPLAVPGVWVVKVTDEKTLQATTLVLGSDLDAIVKASREQVLVFAQDMKTGKGRAGARVLVSDGNQVLLDAKTGDDGVLLKAWEKPRDPRSALAYLVLDGASVAGSGLAVPERVAQGLSARAYLSTDRPAYRPGQEVLLRGVVREVKEGQYANAPGAVYRLEVFDSRGRQFVGRAVTLSDFGTFHERLPVDEGAPVGTYRVRLYQPGKSDFAGQFEVQAYQLEKVDLTFDLPRTVYYRGETIKADVLARYQYGTPLAGRPIRVQLPDGRVLEGTTDAAGKFHVELPTEGFGEEQGLRLVAQLPQDNVAAAASVLLAVRAFRIDLSTPRDVYLDGESIPLRVTTLDAQGEPTGQKLNVSVLKQVEQAGRTVEREAAKESIATDPKTGLGTLAVPVQDAEGGRYVVRVAGTDRFGNPVVAERALTISGTKDETKLRILADRQTFKVGETARVLLHSRARPGTALLTWEADRILSYKLVAVEEGDNPIAWDVVGAQFPNFTLTAARMAGTQLHEARLDVRVERDLRVTVTPVKPAVGPGDAVEVEVATVDQLGRPVSAELSLALVDRALLRLYSDSLPPIGQFFYNQERTGAFTTESTVTFRYEPPTAPVAEAVVEEQERLAAVAKDAEGIEWSRKEAASAVAQQPAPATKPMEELDRRLSELSGAGMGGGGRPSSSRARALGATEDLAGLKSEMAAGSVSNFFAERGDRAEAKQKLDFDGAEGFGRRRLFATGGDEVQTRERFVETAYWNPGVVTGPDGKARVTFRAPTALSEYRFTARGVTGAETLVGQTTADLSVRRDFFVDLKLPSVLTQGDKPRFLAQVHHAGVRGPLGLRLTIYAGGREQVVPRTLELKADGVEEVRFEPFEVPDGDVVRLTLTARAGAAADEMTAEVPIRPWGVQALASASGTASDDATVFVGLPPGRAYESPEMLVVVSPTLRRMLVELALGPDAYVLDKHLRACFPIPPNTLADRAGDLLAACSVLQSLHAARTPEAPEATRLTERIRGLVSELVTAQNEDGGWPWVVGGPGPQPSDRLTSARVAFALHGAWEQAMMTDPKTVERAVAYLQQEFAKSQPGDHETRAALLYALSVWGKATFEQANALNRSRQGLPDVALAYLALSFLHLDRAELAGEVLDVLGPRAQSEPAGPGRPPRRFWSGSNQQPWHRSPAETTALAALAFARVRPAAAELAGAIAWLEAHRTSTGWQPSKARGPAVAALAAFYAGAQAAEDRYRLVVTVNDVEVHRAEVVGAAQGQAIRVPVKALKSGDQNRVRFDIEGRGTFGYAVTLTGFTRDFKPDQDQANRTFVIGRRAYTPADPELNGQVLPTGFSVAINPHPFENTVTQVPLGGRARVAIDAWRYDQAGQPAWERDFLILEEHLPAGTTLVDGSVQSQASHHELADGVLTFYFTPDQYPGNIRYDVYGYLPGQYRALPPRLRSAYEPGRSHLGPAGTLTVLEPGQESTDPYKATPDELYARGKALFDAGKLAEAVASLEELWAGYTLRDDVAKDAARMLLIAHIQRYEPNKIVQYFEVLKEKAPELVIPFDQIRVVGRAYADLGEHERAYLVWRAIAEASYLDDARVGEVLRQRGQTLEGIAFLLNLWREYPGSASIQSDFFALSQVLASLAGRATTDPALRRELAAAEATRSDLLLQSIRLVQVFLSQSPTDPLADEASLALVGSFLELEDHEAVVKLSQRFAELYPRSTFLDSFQYSEALGRFHLGQYDRAIAVAEAIAKATYKDANGVEQPSPNKWQAIYILGQIHDARRQPGEALKYYRQVAERFTDAAGAVQALTREDLTLPEVSVVRPEAAPRVAAEGGVGLRAVGVMAPSPSPEKTAVTLDYRNIATADVKVYPVDLMRLYLTRRNLAGIAGIDLAGIRPLVEQTIPLGDGADYDDKTRSIPLPLAKEGAYLVMVRGDEHYASGIVLVSPLEMEALEEPSAGRVRVTVRDARTKAFVPKVQVKVIGTENPAFLSGQTDLRGVFVAEGVRGLVTAVARTEANQYAFYRGTTSVGAPPATPALRSSGEGPASGAGASPTLDENLKGLNRSNQERQIDRLQKRYGQEGKPQGVQVEKAY
jgi:uncharacterized protein YfaS (alpha-2-macroglobulin family)/TolA-binding protein